MTIGLCFLLIFAHKTYGLPLDDGERNSTENDLLVIVDQRQNGTENYRISIDGVVIAISSLDNLLTSTLSDFDFFEDEEEFDFTKPLDLNSTSSELVPSNVTNATGITKNPTKIKRRRLGVPALMRSILKKKRVTEA